MNSWCINFRLFQHLLRPFIGIGIPTILLCFSIAFVSTKRNALNGRPDMFEGDIDDMTRKHQTPNTRGDHDSFEDVFDAQGDESWVEVFKIYNISRTSVYDNKLSGYRKPLQNKFNSRFLF